MVEATLSSHKRQLPKSLLKVDITTNQEDKSFSIELTKLHDQEKTVLTKKYRQFADLRSELAQSGYPDLPLLPESKFLTFLMTEQDFVVRQNGLAAFIRQLIERKDTCNSKLLNEFLQIKSFFPEVTYN